MGGLFGVLRYGGWVAVGVSLVLVMAAVLVVVGVGVVVWAVRLVHRQSVEVMERWATLVERLVLPEPAPEPAEESRLVRPIVAAPQFIDPTDGLIPDPDAQTDPDPVGSYLREVMPNVDPWLIGAPDLPESIDDTEFDAETTQIMDANGNWVPLEEAQRD